MSRSKNTPLIFLLVLGLIFFTSFILFAGTQGSRTSFEPGKVYDEITRTLDVTTPADRPAVLGQTGKELLKRHDNMLYLLIRPVGGPDIVSVFKAQETLASDQTLNELKLSFNNLSGSPRGYFREFGIDNYYSQLPALDKTWYWVQIGVSRSAGSGWLNSTAFVLMIMSILGSMVVLFMVLQRRLKNRQPTGPRPETAPAAQKVRAERKPFFEKRTVLQAKSGQQSRLAGESNSTDANGNSPAIATPVIRSHKLEMSRAGLDDKGEQADIDLQDGGITQTESQLLYWEHSGNLIEFWKKFIQRLQIYCHQEDYIFLFVRKDGTERSPLQSVSDLEPVIGLKGSVFLSSSYLKENRVPQKLVLKPLTNLKGSLSPSGALLQLPLVSGKQIFGAVLFYRKGESFDEGQIKQIWKEMSSLSADILKIKIYDRALRDETSGLFNQRHFQYSLAHNYKLKGNIPSRSLALYQISLPFNQKHPYYKRALHQLGQGFAKAQTDEEDLFLFRTEPKSITIASMGEARPLDTLETVLNKIYQTNSFLSEQGLQVNAGICVLNDGIYSAKRWLDQALITLQESIHRGPNHIVQYSAWQKSEFIAVKWSDGQVSREK